MHKDMATEVEIEIEIYERIFSKEIDSHGYGG